MPAMINYRGELLRISPKDPKKLEHSATNGRTWITRFSGSSSVGEFSDIMYNGTELLATTSKGLFYSKTDGRTWIRRH